jgi:hypothetical protein
MAVAVIVGMKADSSAELAKTALESTLTGLEPSDGVFVMIDGADSLSDLSLHEFCTGHSRIRLFSSRRRCGLAHGLNTLIGNVLADEKWTLFARMDADDECLPQRFEAQRKFFETHADVDIAGALCQEVDDHGRQLRTKQLPTNHEEILRHLPRRNPLNHPTVMMRRRVFEGGLRYRTDVGLVEDWRLWVDAAAAGFRFANVDQVLLNFRRSKDFFSKRGGWETAMAEWRVRWHARKMLRQSSPANFCYAVAASGLRLMPASIQAAVYRTVN